MTNMPIQIIFCGDPVDPRSVDSAYETESAAARNAGLAIQLIDFEELTSGSPAKAVRRVTAAAPGQSAV